MAIDKLLLSLTSSIEQGPEQGDSDAQGTQELPDPDQGAGTMSAPDPNQES